MSELIYLASPYSSKNPDKSLKLLEEEMRYQEVLRITAELMKAGHHIFSPIVHCHAMAVKYGLPTDWAYWKDYLHVMLPQCKKMWIAASITGWSVSTGVIGESQLAESLNIPISFVNKDLDILPIDYRSLRDYFLIGRTIIEDK